MTLTGKEVLMLSELLQEHLVFAAILFSDFLPITRYILLDTPDSYLFVLSRLALNIGLLTLGVFFQAHNTTFLSKLKSSWCPRHVSAPTDPCRTSIPLKVNWRGSLYLWNLSQLRLSHSHSCDVEARRVLSLHYSRRKPKKKHQQRVYPALL